MSNINNITIMGNINANGDYIRRNTKSNNKKNNNSPHKSRKHITSSFQ